MSVVLDLLQSRSMDLPDHSVRDHPTTLSRLRCSLTPQVLVAERAVSVRLIMGCELCGLMARLWRSCGGARKTSRIARGCSPLSQIPHKPIPADSVHCGTIRNL